MASQPVGHALYASVRSDLDLHIPGFSDCLPDSPYGEFPGLSAELDLTTVRGISLAKAIVKKFVDDTGSNDRDQVALTKFLDSNNACKTWIFPFKRDFTSRGAMLMGEFRSVLDKALHSPVTPFLMEHFPSFNWDDPLGIPIISFFADNGPGASIDATGCSWLEKFSESTLSSSSSYLYELFRSSVFGLRSEAENQRSEKYGLHICNGSKLSFVPKTVNESRCICIEPSLNMYFQKGIQFILTDMLKAFFRIDLTNQQSINREMARIGSMTGAYGTIDLSSASDTISLKMLKWALSSDRYSLFGTFRSKRVDLPDGSTVDMEMVSSMGNAFTFPLQTIIFAAAVSAVYNCSGFRAVPFGKRTRKSDREFAVNGDDIIVVAECYDEVMTLLSLLGFKPNTAKSFNQGLFRESCGYDAWNGHPVRGVYCKTLAKLQDHFSLINRLNSWSAVSGIPLRQTVEFLLLRIKKLFPKNQILYVPLHEGEASGIKLPLEHALNKGVSSLRQSKDNVKVPYYCGGHKFYRAHKWKLSTESVEKSSWIRGEIPTILAALKGEIQRGHFSARSQNGRYVVRRLSTHSWDSDMEGFPLSERNLAALSRACAWNLNI